MATTSNSVNLSLRALYSLLFYLAIPFLLMRMLWRAQKLPGYLSRWHDRFAIYCNAYPKDVLWFHAVSVGEVETLLPLIALIREKHPHKPILITTTTPTGSTRVSGALGQSVSHVYLPYDLPDAVNRFFHQFRPELAIIVETELWPNLYAKCRSLNIPLFIINARLSDKSVRGYQKARNLIHPTLASVKLIAAQTQADHNKFVAIGADSRQVVTLGNMKFDTVISTQQMTLGRELKSVEFLNRWVWLCASTHEGEEQLCLNLYQTLKQEIPGLLLLLAPRHPERFTKIQALAHQLNLKTVTRQSRKPCAADTDVYLLDTLGELKMHYCAANAAFIGGSMVPIGGHNVLEAAAADLAITFGPFMYNFQEIADELLAAQAAIQCPDQETLALKIRTLYQNPDYREQLAKNAKAFVQKNQGVVTKTYNQLADYIH